MDQDGDPMNAHFDMEFDEIDFSNLLQTDDAKDENFFDLYQFLTDNGTSTQSVDVSLSGNENQSSNMEKPEVHNSKDNDQNQVEKSDNTGSVIQTDTHLDLSISSEYEKVHENGNQRKGDHKIKNVFAGISSENYNLAQEVSGLKHFF